MSIAVKFQRIPTIAFNNMTELDGSGDSVRLMIKPTFAVNRLSFAAEDLQDLREIREIQLNRH